MVRRLLLVCALVLLAVSSNAETRYFTDAAGAPVKWEPWGARAIERSAKEKRPLFVSIGYASSYECFRMHREAFLNGENAELLNTYFVPVLLDRLEYPEIAESYETIARSMNGAGGWPLNVVLTPSLEPFAAAGFLSPQDLGRMLVIESNRWANERDAAIAMASKNVEAARALGEKRTPAPIEPNVVDAVGADIAKTHDAKHGGFGTAPKTTQPMTLSFLLRTKNPIAADTMRKIAASAVRDQLGGAFHRGVRDAAWQQPYFEKLLADQALLAIAYMEASQSTKDPQFERIARGILGAAVRDMQRETGGAFDSSQDAHNLVPAQGPEFWNGAFYTWTVEELERITPKSLLPKIVKLFGMERGKRNVLTLADPSQLEDVAVAAFVQTTLLDTRQKRPQPFRETMPIAGHNGLMISALARAGAVFGQGSYLRYAKSAASAIETTLWSASKKTLSRSPGVAALAEDYALLIQGYLDLFEANQEAKWLELAIELQKKQDALFWDESLGRYTTGASVPQSLRGLLHERDDETPAVNSVAAKNLMRLALLVPNEAWRVRPAMIFQSFGTRLRNDGAQLPQLASAYADSLAEAKVVVVTGDADSDATVMMLRELKTKPEPMRVLVFVPAKGEARERIAALLPFVRALEADPKAPAAYVCSGGQCRRQ